MHEIGHLQQLGYTFSGCLARFKIVVDWKKHEHLQHAQAEIWRCQESMEDRPCATVSQTTDEHEYHLEHDHQITDANEIVARCQGDKLVQKWLGPYWCGFCAKIFPSQSPYGPSMSSERNEHILSHYEAGLLIDAWVEIEEKGKTRGEMMMLPKTGDGAFNYLAFAMDDLNILGGWYWCAVGTNTTSAEECDKDQEGFEWVSIDQASRI